MTINVNRKLLSPCQTTQSSTPFVKNYTRLAGFLFCNNWIVVAQYIYERVTVWQWNTHIVNQSISCFIWKTWILSQVCTTKVTTEEWTVNRKLTRSWFRLVKDLVDDWRMQYHFHLSTTSWTADSLDNTSTYYSATNTRIYSFKSPFLNVVVQFNAHDATNQAITTGGGSGCGNSPTLSW